MPFATDPTDAIHQPQGRKSGDDQVLGSLAIELEQVDFVDPNVGKNYDQDEHEWVMVFQGSARLQLEVRTIELGPGDYINLPAHTKHRVQWATTDQPMIWLAIFYKSLAFPAFDIPVTNG